MRVRDIMRGIGEVAAASPDMSVRSAVRVMASRRAGSVIVLDKSEVVGILTERDVMNAIAADGKFDLDKSRVADVMSKRVHSIDADADIEKAVDEMVEFRIKKLPVTRGGRLVGIVTSTDVADDQSEVMTRLRKVLYKARRRLNPTSKK